MASGCELSGSKPAVLGFAARGVALALVAAGIQHTLPMYLHCTLYQLHTCMLKRAHISCIVLHLHS